MNLKDLKNYIYDNNLIEKVLEEIGCHHIQYHKKGYYSCANIDGDNIGAVVVYNEPYLHMHNYTRNFRNNSDIFDLVKYNLSVKNNTKDTSLYEASKYLHNLLNLDFSYNITVKKQKKYDPLAMFKRVLSYKNNKSSDDLDFEIYDNYDFYKGIIHKEWLKEGITNSTINKFDLGYSYKLKRIIIPLKHWKTGDVIGFNKRTIVHNNEEFGISKYLLTSNYPKQINLYGLYENRIYIELNGVCVVFEAEKSVLRRDSRGDHNCVALQGHYISNEQVSILCGLDINEVVIALDKDISINEVRAMCEKFYHKKNVSYIYDKYDILPDEKSSPADASNKIYDYLYRHRVNYDEKEHKKLIDYINNKEQ